MEINYTYNDHLNSTSDLQTHYEDYRSGFLEMAFQKNLMSKPYIEEARALKMKLVSVKESNPKELLNYKELFAPMLTASGISEKAKKFLNKEDQKLAIKNLIENFLEPAGEAYIDELVYRFLLIKGDSFGGTMRNIVGVLAERKLNNAIISSLNLAEIKFKWLDKRSKKWLWSEASNDLNDMVENCGGLFWVKEDKIRTLLFNLTIKKVNKNIDLCLFNGDPEKFTKKDFTEKECLAIAFGELKGGIDPAGADEHWKTAKTALNRIRVSYEREITTFFIGAAIEKSMSNEIWDDLENNILTNAANLTKPDQISSISNWIVSL
ncbi:AvaI/BsoBI family type II restriction endonuclease [Lactococcus petauri]|uniref:AvaI/BsoBI family type II restriction endonuclease n=1 Tax=Lactococcus petauri TaxID=1940789 RepID=UPI0013FD8C90|nr:AvaI/BsoBI family type II restriction endonuclease [Lactococcus petauri]NHI78272.1 restriction endonuclease [Lactococcus petauri]